MTKLNSNTTWENVIIAKLNAWKLLDYKDHQLFSEKVPLKLQLVWASRPIPSDLAYNALLNAKDTELIFKLLVHVGKLPCYKVKELSEKKSAAINIFLSLNGYYTNAEANKVLHEAFLQKDAVDLVRKTVYSLTDSTFIIANQDILAFLLKKVELKIFMILSNYVLSKEAEEAVILRCQQDKSMRAEEFIKLSAKGFDLTCLKNLPETVLQEVKDKNINPYSTRAVAFSKYLEETEVLKKCLQSKDSKDLLILGERLSLLDAACGFSSSEDTTSFTALFNALGENPDLPLGCTLLEKIGPSYLDFFLKKFSSQIDSAAFAFVLQNFFSIENKSTTDSYLNGCERLTREDKLQAYQDFVKTIMHKKSFDTVNLKKIIEYCTRVFETDEQHNLLLDFISATPNKEALFTFWQKCFMNHLQKRGTKSWEVLQHLPAGKITNNPDGFALSSVIVNEACRVLSSFEQVETFLSLASTSDLTCKELLEYCKIL